VMVGMGLIWAMIVQWRLTLVGLSVGPALAVTVVLNEAMVGKAEARNKLKREAVAKTFYEVRPHFVVWMELMCRAWQMSVGLGLWL